MENESLRQRLHTPLITRSDGMEAQVSYIVLLREKSKMRKKRKEKKRKRKKKCLNLKNDTTFLIF
jgi:hypothetical protein